MKSRIVILSTFLTPLRSGAEACAEEIALRLHGEYDMLIVTARLRKNASSKDLLQGKVPVLRIGLGYRFDKWLFPFLAPLAARKAKPDLIHAVLETFAGLALHFCKYLVPGAKRLLTLQTTNRSFLKGPILRSPHGVTAISKALVRVAADLDRTDVVRIPNGIVYRDITSACERFQKVPGRILYVGRLVWWKGVGTLLRAVAKVVTVGAQHTSTPLSTSVVPLQLRIIGEGPERKSLELLAGELGIADRVAFVGFVPIPEIYDEFARGEIFCGLSKREALGNVFIEAQAAGCAVIGTTVEGIPDVIEDGVTGLLVQPGDVSAAEGALRALLQDTSLRKRLAEAGKENAKIYDWSRIAGKYAEVYAALLSRTT